MSIIYNYKTLFNKFKIIYIIIFINFKFHCFTHFIFASLHLWPRRRRVSFLPGCHASVPALVQKIRSDWLPSFLPSYFLPISLYTTHRGQLRDTYFLGNDKKIWPGDFMRVGVMVDVIF
jgi:hypothetical protein